MDPTGSSTDTPDMTSLVISGLKLSRKNIENVLLKWHWFTFHNSCLTHNHHVYGLINGRLPRRRACWKWHVWLLSFTYKFQAEWCSISLVSGLFLSRSHHWNLLVTQTPKVVGNPEVCNLSTRFMLVGWFDSQSAGAYISAIYRGFWCFAYSGDPEDVRLKCHDCGKSYATKYSLKLHVETFHSDSVVKKETNFVCGHCGKKLASDRAVRAHEKTHLCFKKRNRFQCEDCARRFRDYKTLEQHMNVHAGIKPYICETCGKSFARKLNLDQHIVIHSDVKPLSQANG